MDYLLASMAVVSTITAVIVACFANRSNLRAARKDRDSRVRELSLIANKVDAAGNRVDGLANQLKTAYRSLSILAGGLGGSGLKLYTDGIENKQGVLGPMQTAARETLDNGINKLSDEQINEKLLEFERYLAHLDRMREEFHVDLASVESQMRSKT